MNTGLNTRDHKLEFLHHLRVERYVIHSDLTRSSFHLKLADNAVRRLESEIRLDDLVTFCQTGKYPE